MTDDEVEVQNSPATFSPDGGYTTDKDHEFLHLVRRDLETGVVEDVEKLDWDIQYAYFSKNGKYLVVGINNDARTKLRVYDAATMARIELPEMAEAVKARR